MNFRETNGHLGSLVPHSYLIQNGCLWYLVFWDGPALFCPLGRHHILTNHDLFLLIREKGWGVNWDPDGGAWLEIMYESKRVRHTLSLNFLLIVWPGWIFFISDHQLPRRHYVSGRHQSSDNVEDEMRWGDLEIKSHLFGSLFTSHAIKSWTKLLTVGLERRSRITKFQ